MNYELLCALGRWMRRQTMGTPAPIVWAAAATVGCSSAPTAPDPNALSGSYAITGERVLPNNTGVPRAVSIRMVSVSTSRAILDITNGDEIRGVPARDTAVAADGMYVLDWVGDAQYSYRVSFNAMTCTGQDVDGAGASADWATCQIAQVP